MYARVHGCPALNYLPLQVRNLAQLEADRLLEVCGVPPTSNQSGLETKSISELRSLMHEMFIKFSSVETIPDYERISVPRFRVAVSQGVCEGLVACYKTLHGQYIVMGGEANEVKVPEQIATLLGT